MEADEINPSTEEGAVHSLPLLTHSQYEIELHYYLVIM